MKAMLLCAGLGTRLRPLTHIRAKAVMPVLNKPLIVHTLEQLAGEGIEDVIINLHHRPETVRDALRLSAPRGIRIHYSMEEKILGSAGGVKQAEPFFEGERAVIINGDALMDFSLEAVLAFHEARGAAATMVLKRPEGFADYGHVHTDDDSSILSVAGRPALPRDSKTSPRHYTGLQVIEPAVFQEIPPGVPWEMNAAVYPALIRKGLPVYGFTTSWDWLDFGTPGDYLASNLNLLSALDRLPFSGGPGGFMTAASMDRLEEGMEKGEVQIEKQVSISGGFMAGPGTIVREAAELRGVILFENVEIGSGCALTRVMIGPGVKIPPERKIQNRIIIEARGELKEFDLS